MIVNLTRKKFLEMVQKIELINRFEINYAVQKKLGVGTFSKEKGFSWGTNF